MTKIHPLGRPGRVGLAFLRLLPRAARELGAHDPLRLGAATAFFTTFALPPILVLFISVLGSLYPASQVRIMLLHKLSDLLGASGAGMLEQIVQNITNQERSRLVTVFGFVFLLFVATTLFVVIQNTLNQLWQIRVPPEGGRLGRVLRERARSAGALLTTAALAVTALLADSTLHLLSEYVADFDRSVFFWVFQGVNYVVVVLILAVWFGATFRNLGHARIPWPALWRGALLTAFLFEIGERVLHLLLRPRNFGPIYGPASSVLLLLLFVFYSAIIFYFGACFTKIYAQYTGQPLRPRGRAVRYRLVNVPEPEQDA